MSKFQKGNPGRPRGTKNKFTTFKQELLKVLEERKDELKKMPMVKLVQVWASLQPREQKVDMNGPVIRYISNTPRPRVEKKPEAIKNVTYKADEETKEGDSKAKTTR